MVRICRLFADSQVKNLVESSDIWGVYRGIKGNVVSKKFLYYEERFFVLIKRLYI